MQYWSFSFNTGSSWMKDERLQLVKYKSPGPDENFFRNGNEERRKLYVLINRNLCFYDINFTAVFHWTPFNPISI